MNFRILMYKDKYNLIVLFTNRNILYIINLNTWQSLIEQNVNISAITLSAQEQNSSDGERSDMLTLGTKITNAAIG
jgi:hypothetical protein